MSYKKRTIVLAGMALLAILLYVLYELTGTIGYVLPKRIIKVVAIILTGGSIAIATTLFMTNTNNRILTPSIMGIDSLYLLTQSFIIYIFGSQSLIMMNSNLNYLLSIGVM